MNLLNDNEMFSVMQTSIKKYRKEETPIWHTIIREVLSVLIKRGNGAESDDVYDSIFATYGFYNEYVE